MTILLSFIGAFLGIIFAILFIILLIYNLFVKSVGKSNMAEFKDAVKYAKSVEDVKIPMEKKNVVGMTSIYEPLILKDFPDFNKELLFNKVESTLSMIFNLMEKTEEPKDDELILLKDVIYNKINDLKNNNLYERYDDVLFHRHAIKGYKKSNGVATITTSSTLEYYYYTSKSSKYKDMKKQTRYTVEFVYVYDTNLLEENEMFNKSKDIFSVNCPNCAAPITNLQDNRCKYCGTYISDINMKNWKICSYSEDYK